MSIFKTPAPAKAERDGGSVTPMSGDRTAPIVPDPMGDIRHAPNADSRGGKP